MLSCVFMILVIKIFSAIWLYFNISGSLYLPSSSCTYHHSSTLSRVSSGTYTMREYIAINFKINFLQNNAQLLKSWRSRSFKQYAYLPNSSTLLFADALNVSIKTVDAGPCLTGMTGPRMWGFVGEHATTAKVRIYPALAWPGRSNKCLSWL